MFHRARITNQNNAGYSLIEMLITLAILGLIVPALGITISQALDVNAMSGNRMTAVKQVENAMYWVGRDVQMSHTVQPNGSSGFPLNLTWIEWNNTSNNVTYSLQNGKLERTYSINGSQPISTFIAQYIVNESEVTSCQFSNGILDIKITASVGDFKPVTETRENKVVPKPQ